MTFSFKICAHLRNLRMPLFSFLFLMTTAADNTYWIALNMVPGVGAITYRKLLNAFGSPEAVFAASAAQLRKIPGLHAKIVQNIVSFDASDRVQRELDAIRQHNVSIMTWNDPDYPGHLRQIFDPPPILYLKGQPLAADEIMVAVVGSRKASTYGRVTAETLCRELAVKGITVVSGLARGIDSAAHRGSLKAGGRTIAVMGCGVDVVYPPENTRLYEEILEHGAILSELPMHTKPDRGNFPARNRIISGLSLGTVVVEAGYQSGALITADTALEQGREVFAVPGNINSAGSKGTNRLIKQGAGLVERAEDILQELSLAISQNVTLSGADAQQPELPLTPPQPPPPDLTDEEQRIYALLEDQPVHIDTLTTRSQLPSGTVSAILMMLEMKNVIRQLAGKMFVRM
jgi:DNA processing protein